MIEITPRQLNILKLLSQKDLSRADIEEYLETTYKVSKATVVRDLAGLIEEKYIEQRGSGPGTYYALKTLPNNIPIFDLDKYFDMEADKRQILGKKFNFELIDQIDTFFTREELDKMEQTKTTFVNKIASKDNTEVKKEIERFIIELSWKSSKIEGNTYSLLDTENLIKNKIEAPNHTQGEVQMILNHKKAFDYVLKNIDEFKSFSLTNIIQLHALLTEKLDVTNTFREHGVGISGTKYLPLDNKYQIEDAIKNLDERLKKTPSKIVQAFATLVFVSYIQPFADGNKRTARLLSNAILLSNNYYPLSYRNVDEVLYKKALILFYEQFNIYFFKQIFLEQFYFSVENYFI